MSTLNLNLILLKYIEKLGYNQINITYSVSVLLKNIVFAILMPFTVSWPNPSYFKYVPFPYIRYIIIKYE